MNKSFVKAVNKIIEERGGEKYIEGWLRAWLNQPDNEDKMLQALLMKELSAEASRKKTPEKKIFEKVEIGDAEL